MDKELEWLRDVWEKDLLFRNKEGQKYTDRERRIINRFLYDINCILEKYKEKVKKCNDCESLDICKECEIYG